MEILLLLSAIANIVGGVVLFITHRELKKNLPPF